MESNNSSTVFADTTTQNGPVDEKGFIIMLIQVSGFVLAPFMILLNGFCVFAIRECRSLRPQMKTILYHLAITDGVAGIMLLITSATVPNIASFDLWACLTRYGTARIILYVSMMITALLSFDRWFALEYSLRYEILVSTARLHGVIVLFWVTGATISVITVILGYIRQIECDETFIGDEIDGWIPYTVFFASLVVMTLTCGRTLSIARNHIRTISNIAPTSSLDEATMNRKATRTVLLVVLAFIICYTPHYISVIVEATTPANETLIANILGPKTFYLLVNVNSVLNPIIYIHTNKYLKETVKTLIQNAIFCKNIECCKRNAEDERFRMTIRK